MSDARGPFPPIDRPRVEALHDDGTWRPGRLHGWVRQDGSWWAVVTYRASPGIVFYACLPAAAVRRPDGATHGTGQQRTDAGDTPDPGGRRGTRESPGGAAGETEATPDVTSP